ncbi:MAG: DUF922 domain-containing protein, partial [Chitinophagaceae bacterium]
LESSPASAITASGFGYKADIKTTGNKGQINIGVYCFFNKNNSWVKAGKTTEYILGHEQGHFDIAELHARKLNKALKEYKYKSKTVNDDVNRIYEGVMQDHHAYQTDYDQQTDFSRKVEKQREWMGKIATELDRLDEYKSYTNEMMR